MALPEDPGSGPLDSGTPVRWNARTAALFGGLAAAGLIAGIVVGRVTSPAPQAVALRPSQVVATALPTTIVTTTTPAPSPTTAKPKPTPTPTKARPPDYSPIPADATGEKDLDFGFLTAVQKNGDLVTISFDRAAYYTGAAAIERNGGNAPDNDYLIENTNPMIRTFTVQAKAPLIGVNRLVSSHEGPVRQQKLDAASFVTNATTALASGLGIPVWVRHTESENGPITSLAEQYIP